MLLSLLLAWSSSAADLDGIPARVVELDDWKERRTLVYRELLGNAVPEHGEPLAAAVQLLQMLEDRGQPMAEDELVSWLQRALDPDPDVRRDTIVALRDEASASEETPDAPEPSAETKVGLPTVDELMALSVEDRRARLTALSSASSVPYGDTARAQAGLAVLDALQQSARTDAAVVRGFFEAALSTDAALREAAVDAARNGGLPPTTAPQPSATSSQRPPASLEVLQQYSARRLYKGTRSVVSGTQHGVSSHQDWVIYQDSRLVPPMEFADIVGDQATLTRIKKRRNNAIAGIVAASIGTVAAYGVGLAMYDSENTTPTFVGVLGGTAAMLGVLFPVGVLKKNSWPSTFYEPIHASELVRDFNEDVRTDLGLSDEDVRDIEASR